MTTKEYIFLTFLVFWESVPFPSIFFLSWVFVLMPDMPLCLFAIFGADAIAGLNSVFSETVAKGRDVPHPVVPRKWEVFFLPKKRSSNVKFYPPFYKIFSASLRHPSLPFLSFFVPPPSPF